MIGFKLDAKGTYGFKQKRSAWTEGSLVALQVFALADNLGNKTSQTARGSALSRIEMQFKKMAKQKFESICSQGLDFTLFLTGDIDLKYFFDASKDFEQIQSEFLNALSAQTDELGDQVMIYLGATINDFVVNSVLKEGNESLILTIDVDL